MSGTAAAPGAIQSVLVQRAWKLPSGTPAPDLGGFPQVQPQTGEAIRVESWFDTRPEFHPALRAPTTRLIDEIETMARTVEPLRPLTDAEYTRGVPTRTGEYALLAQVGAGDWQLWRGQLASPAAGVGQALAAARGIAGSSDVVAALGRIDGDD